MNIRDRFSVCVLKVGDKIGMAIRWSHTKRIVIDDFEFSEAGKERNL